MHFVGIKQKNFGQSVTGDSGEKVLRNLLQLLD